MDGHVLRSSLAARLARSAAALAAVAVLAAPLASSGAAPSQAAPLAPAFSLQPSAISLLPDDDPLYQVVLQVGASPFTYDLPLDGSVTLPVSAGVVGPQPLAAASVLIRYDPAVLRMVQCAPHPGGPGGYCNAAYDPEHGLARFGYFSDTGVMGDAVFLDLTFEPASVAEVRQDSDIVLLVESLADKYGNYMTSRTQGSNVAITAASGTGAVVYAGAPDGPDPIPITRGLTATVPVVITGVAGVGSATFSLSFDPAIVRPLACVAVQEPGASGLCALHADHVSANLISQDGVPELATTPLTAFTVTFTTAPGALAGQESDLILAAGVFADTSGAPIVVRLANNHLKVSRTAAEVVPLLRLSPVSLSLPDDGRVTLTQYLDNGEDLETGSWGIRYDPLVALAESCTPPGPPWNAVCNATGTPGLVRMSVMMTDTVTSPAQVGTIIFRRHPLAKAGQKTILAFEVTNFADAAEEQLEYNTQGAELTITEDLGSAAAVALSLVGAPPYLLYKGTDLDLPINVTIDPERPIANLTASIEYNPDVLRPTQCLPNSVPDGVTAFCNAQADREKGLVRFNLLAPEGVSGSLTPYTVTFEPASLSRNGDNSPLHFAVEAVTGPVGEPRTWTTTDETILIKEPVPAPRVTVGPPEITETAIYTVALSQRATVPLWVEAVPDLGAGTVEVRYDPAVARATKCTLRPDAAPALLGGFCSLLDGVVRVAFVSTEGIDGNAHLLDIEFAQAPDVMGGESTPLDVVVDNFVNTLEVPIPTSTRGGWIDISCYAPPVTDLHIARDGDNLLLTWTHAGTQATGYQVWRHEANAYFAFGDPGSTVVGTVAAPLTPGDGVAFTDLGDVLTLTGAWLDDLNHYYMVRSMCAPDQGSLRSNRVGKFVRTLSPGWNLVAWPLLVYDETLDAVLDPPLFGTDSPDTADRVLVWNGASQLYDEAWFCSGPCADWGEPWANHWLANDYSRSTLTLTVDAGFWIQNRAGADERVIVLGDVAEADRSVPIGADWQLLGSTFPPLPVSESLDAANFGATGTDSPDTADRLLVWNDVTQTYDEAWYCGGPCADWGEPWANHWLANDYSQSTIVIRPGQGFWFQNRYEPMIWVNRR